MDTQPPSKDRAELTAFLADRDALCPVCAYNLRGLTGEHCPECGRHLVLAVGTTEPKLGAFIVGLIGLSGGLGFCGILLAYVAVFFLTRGFGGPDRESVFKLMAGAVACGLGMWYWVATRRALGRKSDGVRWMWAALAMAFGLVFPAWFILTVR